MHASQAANPQQAPSFEPHPEKARVLPGNRPLAGHEYVAFLSDRTNTFLWIGYPAKESGPEMVNLQPHIFSENKRAWEPVYPYAKVLVNVYELENVVSCGTVGNKYPAVLLRSQFVGGNDSNGRCEFRPALLVPGARINLPLDDEQRSEFERCFKSSFLKAGFVFLGSTLLCIETTMDSTASVTTVKTTGFGLPVYQLAQASTAQFHRDDPNDLQEMLAKLRA